MFWSKKNTVGEQLPLWEAIDKIDEFSANTLIRIGVTGSEFIGRKHVKAGRRAPEAEIVTVAGGGRSKVPAGWSRVSPLRGNFSFCSQSFSEVYELFMNGIV